MKPPSKIAPGEITPERTYLTRRSFMRAGLLAGSVAATAALYRRLNGVDLRAVTTAELDGVVGPGADAVASGFDLTEARTPLTSVANYNNYYEFTTDNARGLVRACQAHARGEIVVVDA